MRYPLSRIGNTYQGKIVNAKTMETVFEIIIPHDAIVFIDKIANSWYPNTIIYFIVDGESEIIKQEIPLNNPRVYDPPIVARNFIRFVAYNNSEEDHYFEVLCDGYYVKSTT